jgi:PAS domain S-box-containing protein
MPHGYCLQWNVPLLGLFLIGNLLTAFAYFSIPLTLSLLIKNRDDLSFKWVYGLFAAFIVACGTTHLMKVWTIWFPTYWLEAALDMITGIISLVAAVLLWWVLPRALAMRGAGVQMFQDFFDAMPQLGWTAKPNGDFDFYNKGWYEYTGTAFKAMQGWGWQTVHDPNILPSVKERWMHSLKTETPFEMEFPLKSKSGAFRWFLSRVIPYKDKQGKLIRWIGISADIDDRKQAEALVLQRQMQLETMSEVIPQIVWTANADGLVDYFNSRWSEYSGLAIDHTREWGWKQVLHPDDLPNFADRWSEAISTGNRFEVEYRFRRADGVYRWHLGLAMAVKDDRGCIISWVGSSTDINEQKERSDTLEQLVEARTLKLDQLANDLARSNNELEQFAYVASHDLQEPLRTVISFCDLLAKKNRGALDADSTRYLDVILESSARMQQLIKDLLLYARLQSQGNDLGPVDLSTCLNEAIKALNAAIVEADAKITCDEMPTVTGDAMQLSLLFQNLIANAIKFRGAEPSQIHIGASKGDEGWIISCTDNGIGMKMEYAERIFVIFQRLHSRSKFEGTGIGLAVCKRIVERHGGKIAVNSVVGKGSTFTFTLKG